MSAELTKRHPLSSGDRRLLNEMLGRIRMLKDVASYYFLTGNSANRQEVAAQVLKCTDLFYANGGGDEVDCERGCWDGTRCVDCTGGDPPDPPKGEFSPSADIPGGRPGPNDIPGGRPGPRR